MESPFVWVIILLLTAIALIILWRLGAGLTIRWRSWRQAIERRQIEDALKYVLNRQQDGKEVLLGSLGSTLHMQHQSLLRLAARMQNQGLIDRQGDRLSLTPAGQSWALQVVRAHRLWERYLADEARLPLTEIHTLAHKLEHKSSQVQIDDLDAALGYPSRDPHGDPIPDAAGELRLSPPSDQKRVVLTDWEADKQAIIVHLEDEPPIAYAQLIAEGLQVDQSVTILEKTQERITLTDGQREITIAPAIAGNVFVQPLEEPRSLPSGVIPLSELPNRMEGQIIKLDERCQGFTRRRFLDLGLTPGTSVCPELENPFREPRAYRVRGTLIALRKDQAAYILVLPETNLIT